MTDVSYLTHLECGLCGEVFGADKLWNLCPKFRRPLLARYDLAAARAAVGRSSIALREPTLWRYRELLPLRDIKFKLCLGEGFTPLFQAVRLGQEIGFENLSIKDEGLNPTGSFKARGLAVAVSRAWELGVKSVSIPTAGNAGCAMSAYAALAGMEAHVFMPADVPKPFINECRVLGATVTLIDGLITDCGKAAREGVEKYGRFDVSTLKEPYRIEGKKTMGYELAEQMGWTLPDVIIYPTGGGTGLVGMSRDEPSARHSPVAYIHGRVRRKWTPGTSPGPGFPVPVLARPGPRPLWKAFDEMEKLGWIGAGEKVVLFNTGNGAKYSHIWDKNPNQETGRRRPVRNTVQA